VGARIARAQGPPQRPRVAKSLSYTVRPCTTRQELAACVKLQKKIWGYTDLEVYPHRLFVNLRQTGGHVVGAFAPKDGMVGFVASMPAWRDGCRYYHSLSLGVLPAHENRGLGRVLKLAQRRLALRAGVELIEWTFDPLRAKNAYFNIVRLGAVCRRYIRDHYGEVDSRWQRGLPSDRLVAEWWLKSRRVRRVLAGQPLGATRKQPAAVVEIPRDFDTFRKSSLARARKLQAEVRERFEKHFARGLTVTRFVVDGTKARYLLDAY